MTLTTRQLYFEAVKVGDELPPLVKPPVDRLQIARYVGAAGDFNPLYVDEPHAKAAGFPSTRAPGMVAMSFMGELASDWVRGARLRRFQSRFVKIIWPNDVLTARGRVTERRFEPNGVYTVDIEVWAENQKGELVARGLTTFQLFYSAEDETRQRAGQPPLVVTPEEEEARLARLSRAQVPRPPVAPRPLQPPRPMAALLPPPPSVTPPRPMPAVAVPPRPAARPVPAAPAARPAPAAAPPARAAARPAATRKAGQAGRKAHRKPARPARKPAAKKVVRTPARKAASRAVSKAARKRPSKKKR
jgi:acyl dehydratase